MIREVLYDIDPNTMILGLLFIIFFLLIQFALKRMLGKNSTSSIIAFCISLLAVYGINRTNFDVTGIFYGMGINEGTIYTIVPLLILVGIVLMVWKLKIALTLLYLGLFLIAGSFFTFEQEAVLIAGGVLVVLGIIGWFIKKKREKKGLSLGSNNNTRNSSGYTPNIPKKRPLILLLLLMPGLALIIVNFVVGNNIWILGTGIGLAGLAIIIWIFKLFKKRNPGTNTTNNTTTNNSISTTNEKRRQKGINNLTNVAKKFKSWAKGQKNPKFSGSWAVFVGWLKDAKWGKNEKDICNNLGITINDFRWVFNKYGKV